MAFLRDILDRSKTRLKKDLEMLLELKRQEEGEACTKIKPWIFRITLRAHKATLGVDEGKLREYFPLEHTTRRDFIDLRKAVKCDVRKANARSSLARRSRVLRGLRERRYIKSGWILLSGLISQKESIRTARLPLRPSFLSDDEAEVPPACVNIGNLSRSTDPSKPSLLRFREVETFFHEFGHVMHCVLTKSKHSMQAWAWSAVPWPGGVEQDF